ncbi:MAG: hypothetical protein JSV31_18250 [Desulfobacterales bacterium]|nr:MAG: hypothetical protein JSV31_18250 [Desulfobacterales bacterium]
MVIIPREKPVVENLNIYYLNIKKLLEHYQGEIGSGGVYFKSHAAEGAIFFDKDDLLNGYFRDKSIEISGTEAIERLLDAGGKYNFNVTIYQIPEDEVYFWASIYSAEKIYKDLSTEFTDLEGLIKKMSSEKLTGYIDVSIGDDKEAGVIFMINGRILGGSYSSGNDKATPNKENQQYLIQKTKKKGGTFNVCRIPLPKLKTEDQANNSNQDNSENTLDMLEELLATFESVVLSSKKVRKDFNKLLKQKFVENADKYAFLDPFAGEFEYSSRGISFVGDVSDKDLANGIIDSVKEMAQELGILPRLVGGLGSWSETYAEELKTFGIEF